MSILKDHDLLTECDAGMHISWIKTLQRPDGFFRGPWSKRPVWEDTFHAVKSLDMLGTSLHDEQARHCRKSCSQILVQNGLAKDAAGVVYHCLGTLEALSEIAEDIHKSVSDWVSAKIEQLLLTNIALNYEEVHFVLMTYRLISEHVNISSNSLDLLAERLQTALDAELDCIRI